MNILGNRTYAADPTFVSTFNSISIYWLPADPDTGSAKAQSIQYSELGSGIWKSAQAMFWDSSSAEGYRGYRGSIVFLKAGTSYDIDMLIGGESGSAFRDTVTTWAETADWPIVSTTTVTGLQIGTQTYNTSGTSSGYHLYDLSGATFNAAAGTRNITISGSKIIVRGAPPDANGNLATTLRGATTDAIFVSGDSILIEYLDIAEFGAADTQSAAQGQSGIRTGTGNFGASVIQRNYIHSPNGTSLRWVHDKTNLGASDHPGGPVGIKLNRVGDNVVVRYNTIDGGGDNWMSLNVERTFLDGIQTGPDDSTDGGFKDTDIYGNLIQNTADDAMEVEGRGLNVRVWHNYANKTFQSIGMATVALGPVYVWRNISDSSRKVDYYDSLDTDSDLWGRGNFIKAGEVELNAGPVYIYHNTVLSDTTGGVTYGLGHWHFVKDDGGSFFNYTLVNNIIPLSYVPPAGPFYMKDGSNSATNTSIDNLLTGGSYDCCGGTAGTGDETAWPTFSVTGTGHPTVSSGDFSLQNGSTGEESGTVLAEMFQHNDNVNPAKGAMENTQDALEFGHTAYLNLQGGGGAVSGRYLLIDRTK